MQQQNNRMLFGQDVNYKRLIEGIENAKNSKGSVFLISGESGFGKSHLMNMLYDYAMEKDSGAIGCYVQVPPPIGDFNVSTLQPLYPFQKIVEQLLDNKHMSAEKKLAVNMTMSFLAALPAIGEIAYLAKEWKRDLKQFKGEKSGKTDKDNAAEDYLSAIKKYANKYPLVLLIDDIHWADAQSIELIQKLQTEIHKLPVFLVVTYKISDIEGKGLPIFNFLSEIDKTEEYNKIQLDVFQKSDIREASKKLIKNYRSNNEFEDWIFEKSFGVPGIVYEYLKYFSEYSPFGINGELVTNFEGNEFLPASIQSVFSQKLDSISEEEKNILALCSSEGRQFTAVIVSELMNTDILSAIKKLRAIQNKTGIIKSIGARKRYGIKTTVYEFTQAFYRNYFENSLEFEEYTAIHGQIAALLKQKFDEADAEEIKQQIAPYLAAHSAESGDDETVKEMLLTSAKTAKEFGSADVLKSTLERMKKYGDITEEDAIDLKDKGFENLFEDFSSAFGFQVPSYDSNGGGGFNGNTSEIAEPGLSLEVDYDVIKEKAIELYHSKKFKVCSESCRAYKEKHDTTLSSSKKSLLHLISAKAMIEIEDFSSAEDDLIKVSNLVEKTGDDEMQCFAFNVYAIMRYKQQDYQKAMNYLNKAAQLSFKIAPELRLLTISNIAYVSKLTDPEMAEKYFSAARNLSKELDYKEFSTQLFDIYS